MGNRAAVVFIDKQEKEISPAVYLHWNGGPESIYAFLHELERRKCNRNPADYQCARFIHIVGDFFDINGASNLSLGVFPAPAEISPAGLQYLTYMADDNGVYAVADSGKTIRRFTARYRDDGKLEAEEESPAWVRDEAEEATGSEKYRGIAKELREFRPLLDSQVSEIKAKKYLSPNTPIGIAADWFELQGDSETAEKIKTAYLTPQTD